MQDNNPTVSQPLSEDGPHGPPPRLPPRSSRPDWPYELAASRDEISLPQGGPRTCNLLPRDDVYTVKGTKESRARVFEAAFRALDPGVIAQALNPRGTEGRGIDTGSAQAPTQAGGQTMADRPAYQNTKYKPPYECYNNPAFISAMVSGAPSDGANHPRGNEIGPEHNVMNPQSQLPSGVAGSVNANAASTSLRHRKPVDIAPPSGPPLRSPTKRKFYSVTRGRQTGVFNNWHHVKSLVTGIDGCQVGFSTEAEALLDYEEAKRQGLVAVVRKDKLEDAIFGPREEASQ